MLSVNGSPIANPYQLGLTSWLQTVNGDEDESVDTNADQDSMHDSKMSKKGSNIIVRSSTTPLFAGPSHSRSNSVMSHASHSRSNSQSKTLGHTITRANTVHELHPSSRIATPALVPNTPSLAALVSVPTIDGHLLEFDPLRTAPEEIDALQGISDNAKKQAKEDMMHMIQAAVQRWNIA